MGSTSFAVSMYLQAYNRMAPVIQNARQMLRSLGATGRQVSQQTSRLNPVGGWDKKIDVVIRKMRQLGKESDEVREKSERLMGSGFRDMTGAAAIVAPSLMALKYSADIQTQATTMQVGGFSKEGVARIKQQSLALSKEMAFDWGQVMGVSLALQKAGMNEAKVMNTQSVTTKYAQLEYNRYGSDPFQTATHLAHIAETAGVLYVTAAEREKHALNTQEKMDAFVVKKYSAMAEYLNKVVTSTSSDTARLAEALKYSMPEGVALGWNAQQVLMMTGVQSRFGIEGSMAGTHLKDFASRLNPFLHYLDEDAGKRSARLSAMLDAGWVKDAVYTTTKAGHKKFYSIGESVFHDESGNLKGPEEIFKHIFETYQRFQKEGRVLQFKGILHDVLGEQGKDIVNLLNKNPEMIEHLVKDMGKVMSIEQGIARYQKDANSAWDIFKGNIKTVSTMLGDLVLDDFSNSLQGLNKNLFGQGNDTGKVYKWVEEHQDLIKSVFKATLSLAALAAVMGLIKIAAGGLMFFLVSPFLKGVGWLAKFLGGINTLRIAFQIARGSGFGFWRSIWEGIKLAFPWLGKLAGWASGTAGLFARLGGFMSSIGARAIMMLGRGFVWLGSLAGSAITMLGSGIVKFLLNFGSGAITAIAWIGRLLGGIGGLVGGWMVAAARIAAGWLIAMGPAGWIIAGVSAIIAAAVWAWNTNFMGFRDKCIKVWDSIIGHVKTAIGWIGGFIDKIKTVLGLSKNLPGQFSTINVQLDEGNHPFIKGGNKTQTSTFKFNQVNHIKVATPKEGGEYVKNSVPDKYTNPEYNPRFSF